MGGTPTRSQSQLLEPRQRPISSPLRHPQPRGAAARQKRFPVGSLVEVQTNEEDYKGVYFLATVIFSSGGNRKKNSKKLHVEYHNLLAQENGSDRLREYVDISWVRPAPQPEELCTGFELGDIVDAFFTDGWWTGVVTRVVEGGERFVVTFQHPPDEREFGLAELRVHWDWVSGIWYRPVKKGAADSMFDMGKKVEVSFVDIDAWFPATIHEVLGNGAFLVEYTSKKNDEAQALKMTVDSLHVRPSPPLLKDRSFTLLERVDAYFDFGWWNGVITKVLEGGKYNVFFKLKKSEKEFNQSELRPQMEWKNGKWTTDSELSQKHQTPENARGNTAAVNTSGDRMNTSDGNTPSSVDLKKTVELSTPVNQKPTRASTAQTKRKQTISYSISQPLKQHKEGNKVGSSQNDTHDVSIKEKISASLSPVPVDNMITSAKQTATGDQSSDNPSSGKKTVRKQRTVGAILNEGEKVNSRSSPTKKSRTQILQGRSQKVVGGKEADAGKNEGVEVQNEHPSIENEPVIIGLPCSEIESPGDGISRSKRARFTKSKEIVKPVSVEKQQLNGSATLKSKDGDLSGTGQVSGKRKRGRPARGAVENPETPVEDDLSIKDGELGEKRTEGSLLNQKMVSSESKDKDGKPSETGESSGKRKRGRPPARVIGRHMKENGKNGAVGSVSEPCAAPELGATGSEADALLLLNQEKIGSNEDTDKVAHSQPEAENKEGSTPKSASSKTVDKNMVEEPIVVKDLIMLQRKRSSGRGRRQSIGEKFSAPVEGSLDATVQKTMEMNSGMEVDKEVASEPTGNELDDQPLSRWIGGINSPSPSTVDSAIKGKSSQTNVEQGKENSKKPEKKARMIEKIIDKDPESGKGTSALNDKASVDSVDLQTLPFAKNPIYWKMFGSMEVFKRMPQRPHFKPLEQFNESSREGLAIGHMVTFSTVVEKVSKLKFSDANSISDEILETLAALEKHGFDVTAVQDRVTKLQALKDGQKKTVDEINELNSQISLQNAENTKIDKEISEMKEQIRRLQEKHSLAESARRKGGDEIEGWNAKLLKCREGIKNVEREFESIAASTLL